MHKIKSTLKKIYKLVYVFRIISIKFFYICKFNMGGVNLSKSVIFERNISFYRRKDSIFHVKDRTRFCKNCKIVFEGGRLIVGEGCTLGEQNIFNVFNDIYIGDNVVTADRVSFITNIHNYDDISRPISSQHSSSKPIYVGSGSWLGINSTILAGSSIGKNCVVGANAVVTGEFPDYCVIVGVPARIVKTYDAEKKEWVKVEDR